MTADLHVILLAPHPGSSGVGDYATAFTAAVAPHVRQVVEFRHAGSRAESTLGILRERRRFLRVLAETVAAGPVVVHSELSGGAVVPFWATLRLPPQLRSVRRTATLHDPPRAVWYPFLTRGVSRGRILNQAIHRPLHRLLERLERRALRDVDLFVLTGPGAEATRALGIGRSVTRTAHLPLGEAAPVRPPSRRPVAVGLFGHVYTGKGFDLLPALRRALPPEVAVRVAGRGTETLRPVAGVDYVGTVAEEELAGFFDSVRLLLMPYDRPPVGGHEMLPASGTHARAVSTGTPTLALRSTGTQALADAGLCTVVDGGADALAAAAAALVTDEAELDRLSQALLDHRAEHDAASIAADFLGVWAAR